jgi:hypothetical protein
MAAYLPALSLAQLTPTHVAGALLALVVVSLVGLAYYTRKVRRGTPGRCRRPRLLDWARLHALAPDAGVCELDDMLSPPAQTRQRRAGAARLRQAPHSIIAAIWRASPETLHASKG